MQLLVLFILLIAVVECTADTAVKLPRWKNLDSSLWQSPSRRYSHAAVSTKDGMVMSHGYYYDHRAKTPMWLNDTWFYSYSQQRWGAVKISDRSDTSMATPVVDMSPGHTVTPAEVHNREQRVVLLGPLPRYKPTLVTYNDAVYLFGGDDGGHSTGSHTHVWGCTFNDLWRLRGNVWTELLPSGRIPPARQGHAAVVLKDSMYIVGGIFATERSTVDSRFMYDLNDVWEYQFQSNVWIEHYALSASSFSTFPKPRRSHTAVAISADSFLLFGGFTREEDYKNVNDLWLYAVTTRKWREITPATPDSPWPGVRGAHAAASDPNRGLMYVFGGAECTGGCYCNDELWQFSLKDNQWTLIQFHGSTAVKKPPSHTALPERVYPNNRHYHTMVMSPAGQLYVFGGESYNPYMYFSDIWRFDTLAGGSGSGSGGETGGDGEVAAWHDAFVSYEGQFSESVSWGMWLSLVIAGALVVLAALAYFLTRMLARRRLPAAARKERHAEMSRCLSCDGTGSGLASVAENPAAAASPQSQPLPAAAAGATANGAYSSMSWFRARLGRSVRPSE